MFCKVVIPSEAVWASNAAFATDFQLHLQRPHENAAVQVSITSKDDYDSDIPLSVSPRIRVTWQPKDFAGVQCIRRTWEQNETGTLSRTPSSSNVNYSSRTNSLSRNHHPSYFGGNRTQDERHSRIENGFSSRQTSTLPRDVKPGYTSPSVYTSSKPVSVQDKNWNVVSPTSKNRVNEDDNLPQWAKGYGDEYDYDDVLVV